MIVKVRSIIEAVLEVETDDPLAAALAARGVLQAELEGVESLQLLETDLLDIDFPALR
jgi:hypothetical protein